LLDRTGQLQTAQKRYDDSDIIVSELMEWGYNSARGLAALRRMNQIHGRFAIAKGDFLYVHSTFVFEPIRWNARFGWRPMCDQEKLAMFYFWRAVGQRMNIRGIPAQFDDIERYNTEYERERVQFALTNKRVGSATHDMFASWFPAPAGPLVRRAIYALMDDPLLVAFRFPKPSAAIRRLVFALMRLRARALRSFPPRGGPRLRTAMSRPKYAAGYKIEQVGPPVP
jgi:hypothetical protein